MQHKCATQRCMAMGYRPGHLNSSNSSAILHGKAGSATTGFAGIGICKREAPGVKTVLPVDLHTHQVNTMTRVHNIAYAARFENLVGRLFIVETKYITHPGAAAAFYTDPQVFGMVKV